MTDFLFPLLSALFEFIMPSPFLNNLKSKTMKFRMHNESLSPPFLLADCSQIPLLDAFLMSSHFTIHLTWLKHHGP